MNFGDFLHSKRWRLIQNYIYSWGASVVLIGALFKLEHLPYAGTLLGVGMSIEAIIFFVSAFEPLMEMPDWKKVYPQMRTGEETIKELENYQVLDQKYPWSGGGSGGGTDSGTTIKGISDDKLKKLNDSFDRLSKTAEDLNDITSATVATNKFVKNLDEAASSIGKVVDANGLVSKEMGESVKGITESYKSAAKNLMDSSNKAAEEIKLSVGDLSTSIKQTSTGFKATGDKFSAELEKTGSEFTKQMNTSSGELAESYKSLAKSISGGYKDLEKSSVGYKDNIEKINKNLSLLNSAYELHLKGAGKVDEMVKQYSNNVGEIGKLLSSSVEETKKFNENTKEINENIQALNKIYGKMLGALNSKK